MRNYYWQSLKYGIEKQLLRKKVMSTTSDDLGLLIQFLAGDAVGRGIYKSGGHDTELTKLLAKSIPFNKGDVFLDIGANIGWYSLSFARLFPEITIYAFEPEPDNFDLLSKNIAANNLNNINPINKALADSDGFLTLYKYPVKNAGRHSLLPINDHEQINVPTQRLDHFMKEKGMAEKTVKFLKIDVEGYEPLVLGSAKNTLANTENVLLEFSPSYIKKGNLDQAAFVGLLKSFGFDCFAVIQNQFNHIEFDSLYKAEKQVNLFLSKV